jgi:uncharacterized protein YbjT (DUF2867 family)
MKTQIFITGGSGYIGSRLIKKLLEDGGYRIHALVRRGSENKLPEGCNIIYGNALDAGSYKNGIPNGSVFIHLVGVPHPSPAKKELFKKIDAVSIQQAVSAAKDRHVLHFIYLSVSQYPSVIMRDYQLVRAAGEALLKQSGFGASIIRPWYVLGPGHWWPVLLKPFFWLASLIPSWATKTKHFDTVTIEQMINILMVAIKNTADGIKHYEIEDIRQQHYRSYQLPAAFWAMPKVQ